MTYIKFAKIVVIAAAFTLVACNKSNPAPAGNKAKNAAVPPTPTGPVANSTTPGGTTGAGTAQTVDPDDLILHDQSVSETPTGAPVSSHGPVAPATTVPVTQTPTAQPATQTAPIVVSPAQVNAQCGEAYVDTTPEWYPGLPTPPTTTPIFTDVADTSAPYRYTDARQDGLFAFAIDRANSLPDVLNNASRELAKQIRDVHIYTSATAGSAVKVQVLYQHQMGKAAIELHGVLSSHPTDVKLVQIPAPGKVATFAGVMTCADIDHGCKNIVLRLDQISSKSKKITHSVFIVHRWGEAHVTMSESERRDFARIRNNAHTKFSEYLSNTANNACLNLLAENAAGKRQLPACALQRLQSECGSEMVKSPSARSFGLRSWAVAYGHSGFELSISSNGYTGLYDYDAKQGNYLDVQGPLAYSSTRPVYPHPLPTAGAATGIKTATLVNNDGGGNLNIELDFTGDPASSTRIGISSLLPNTRYNSDVLAAAHQMPALPGQ